MKKMKTILFVKADKTDWKNNVAIYVKIKANLSTTTFFTGFYVDAVRWKTTDQLTITREKPELKLRYELDSILEDLLEISDNLRGKNVRFSAHTIKEIFRSGELENLGEQIMLSELFDQHESIFEPMVESGNRAPETLRKYQTLRKHVYEFLKLQYRMEDIELPSLNYEFVDSFDAFLRSVKGIANNATVKYIQSFRAILRMAVKYEWIPKDPFVMYDKKVKKKDAVFLTKDELERIENIKLKSERLRVVRDIFVFNCYTGFAPVDLVQLTWDNIVKANDGQKWIMTYRQKTGVRSDVPLLPKAEEILTRYKEHPECVKSGLLLPKRSNQKMNQYLKEIASFAGVNKRCTQYCARHSFATTVTLANGISMEVLSKMMGHTDLSTTAHYGKIQNLRVGEEMRLLKESMLKNDD